MADGFINVLKPPGMTSHDVVSFVRRVYGLKKVGHAGTLDPAAAGVLPVAIGRATRLIEYLADADKAYRTELTFGFATDSGDDTGTVVEQADFTMPTTEQLAAVFADFVGRIKQVPPVYSAIKINGQRACDLVRKNVEVSIPEREVTIHRLKLLDVKAPIIRFDVDCSKGTYIRSLCIDIGKRLEIPAAMSFLIRQKVGAFCLEQASTLDEIKAAPAQALCQMDHVLAHLPRYQLNASQGQAFCQGQRVALPAWDESTAAIRIYSDDRFIGIARYDAEYRCLVPAKVIA